jgi:uncharacterized membrane protein YczE
MLTAGLLTLALGIALSVKANLGISPVSCIPYVFSLSTPLTLGMATILFNLLLILLQIGLLRRAYQPVQLLQLPVVILFGFFIDFALLAVSGLTLNSYLVRLSVCLVSCLVMGFGVFLEIKANVTFLPGEGVALAVAKTLKIDFGRAKIGADSSMVLAGLVSSLILMGNIYGIREGTFISALLIGYTARHLTNRFPAPVIPAEEEAAVSTNR